MKALIELTENIEIITEGEGSKKNLYLQGISIQTEVVNGNKRFYPTAIVDPEVNKYIEKNLKTNTATGELNHPTEKIIEINPDRISHIFTEIKKEGNNYISKARVLNTTCGKQVKNLAEGGVRLGMSSRALGKTKLKNNVAVVEGMHLVTLADIVVNPSAPDAWQQAIFENKEWVFENGVLVEKDVEPIMDDVKNILNAPSKEKDNIIIGLFEKYLKTIKVN